MNTERILYRSLLFTYLLSALVLMLALNSPAFGQSKPSPERIRQIDRMIDAMASHNKAPEIIQRYGYVMPLVSPNYDWSEQERVQKAIKAVQDDKSDEMWRRCRDHEGWRDHASDERYVMTLVFDRGEDSKNISVGDICAAMPGPDYDAAYIRHLPKVSGRYFFDPIAIITDDKYAGRPLCELQIVVCEQAIKDMANLKATEHIPGNDYRDKEEAHTFTAEEKAKFTESVRKEIEELKRTKKPVIGPEKRLGIYKSVWEPLDAQEAKKVREAYEKEKNVQMKDGEGK